MEMEEDPNYEDQETELANEVPLEHGEPEDEELEGELGYAPLGPDILHDETTRLAVRLGYQDEGERLVGLSDMRNAITGKQGENILVSYVLASPQCAELMNIWLAGPASPPAVPLMQLLFEMFKHPLGKGEGQVQERDEDQRRRLMAVRLRLDKLARSLVRNRMKDIYSHLSSSQKSRQNAALLLLAAIVGRGRVLAIEIATTFDFTLEALRKLARPPRQQKPEYRKDMILKRPTRFAFVNFAMSFLEVGDPGLLRWILQKRPLYAGVLHNLSKDDETTVVKVLVLFQEVVMAPEMMVPRGLQSVLFGDATLDQLARVCADESLQLGREFAYDILLRVCTDPSHGLCPDSTEIWEASSGKTGAFGGGQARLLRLMSRLKVIEVDAHRDVLLATGRARPKFAAAYLAAIPFSLEPRVSPAWFTAMSLIATLIPLASQPPPFTSLARQGAMAPAHDGPLIRGALLSLLPPALSRLVLNRGLQHADTLVKHACLRVLQEALLSLRRLLEAVDAATVACSEPGPLPADVSGTIEGVNEISLRPDDGESRQMSWRRLSQSIQDTMRAHLPDPNILYGLLNSRKTVPDADGKGLISTSLKEGSLELSKKRKRANASSGNQSEERRVTSGGTQDYESVILQLWGPEATMDAGRTDDYEVLLHSKVLDVLAAFQKVLPIALADTGFDAFKLLPDNPIHMPIVQQNALTALLLGVTGYTTTSSDNPRRVIGEFVGIGSAYKRLKPLLLLMLTTESKNVSEAAYYIIQRIMMITGAFDHNPAEISLWLDALVAWKIRKGHGLRSSKEDMNMCLKNSLSAGTIHASLVDFLAEAVGSVGRNIYRYLDRLQQNLSKFTLESDMDDIKSSDLKRGSNVAEFGPFVICAIDSCLRLMRSGSKTSSQQVAVAAYVGHVLHALLNYQVHPPVLASVLLAELSTETAVEALKTFQCSPVEILRHHSEDLLPSTKVTPRGSHSEPWETTHSSNSEAGKLPSVLKACKKDLKVPRVTKLEALRSLLLCTPVEELLANFPSIMEVFADFFDGDSSTLIALVGVHRNLLTKIWKSLPELFSLALELAGIVRDRNGDMVTSEDLKSPTLKSVDPKVLSGAVGLCALFLTCPFPLLFSAAIYGERGCLLTCRAFTKILQAAAVRIPSSNWVHAVRVVVSGINHLLAASSDGGSALDTCFTLLCDFFSYPSLKSGNVSLTPFGEDDKAVIEDYRLMILDLLNHPVLYNIFLSSDTLSDSSCPVVSELRRDSKDEKVCDTSLKRVLAAAASGVNAVDGHILALIKRLLESAKILVKSTFSSSLVHPLQSLQEDISVACRAFIRKALAILSKEVEASRGLGVVASPSLFAVSVLIPFSDPSYTIDFLLSLFPVGTGKVRKRKQGVAEDILGLYLVTLFVDSLSVASGKQGVLVHHFNGLMWEEQSERTPLSQRIFDLYERVSEQVMRNPSVLADLCLLSFLEAFDPKVAVVQKSKDHFPGFDKTRFADLPRCSPLAVLRHCLMRLNDVTSRIATLLVESSPVHLSEFGWLFARATGDRGQRVSTEFRISFADKLLVSSVKQKTSRAELSDNDLLEIWPAAKSYLKVKLAEESCEDKEIVDHVIAVYGSYLEELVSRSWDKFFSIESVKAWYARAHLRDLACDPCHHLPGRILEYCHRSPAGQLVEILRLCHSFHAGNIDLQNRLFRSILSDEGSKSFVGPEIAGEDIHRLVSKVFAEVSVLRYLIGSGLNLGSGVLEESHVVPEDKVNHVVLILEPQKDSTAARRFLTSLVYTLGTIYKSGGIDWRKEIGRSSVKTDPGRGEWLRFLEQELLTQVIRTAEELVELPLNLPSYFSVYKYALAMLLGYRYGEVLAMKAARYLSMLFLRCMEEEKDLSGRTVDFDELELLISHSKFLSSMLARDSGTVDITHLAGKHAGKGIAFNSLTSVLLLVGSPLVDHLAGPVKENTEAPAEILNSKDVDSLTLSQNPSEDTGSQKKIELVKLLRILLTLRLKQCTLDMGGSETPPLEQLLSVLLAAYGGTLSELDQEIFALMHEIESHGGPGFVGLSGLDYVWGEAALKRRKTKSSEIVPAKSEPEERDNLAELRRQTFKEDLLIDPRRCGLTVLFFPHKRPMPAPKVGIILSAKQFKDCPQGHRERTAGFVERELKAAAYDPAFLLPFAVHGLSIGCISAEEFVRLGLLAVAFASISSADETMRKSGYEVLAKYYALLESCPSFKSRRQIRLLMTYVKNSVSEAWQKLPRVLSIFAAEASCILMNPENHHYLTINRFLLRAPSLDIESIPLFQIMFGSGSVQYRSDRLWMLRLLAAGLGSSLDAHIYRRKFVLELLMSFYDSEMADAFTRKWVLQVLFQAALVRSCAKYLVQHTGLLSWLGSVAVNESNSNLQDNDGAGELASASLKIIETILSWGVVQSHLQTDGWEELSKVAVMFHRFLVRNSTSHCQKIFAKPTVNVMTLVLRISHRRKKHQTRFTLNIVGIQEVINWFKGGIPTTSIPEHLEETTKCLKMILHSSPPPILTLQDKIRLYKIASWGVQLVMESEQEAVFRDSVEDFSFLPRTSGKAESLSQKLRRWLAAALVLGDISRVKSHADCTTEVFTTCLEVVNFCQRSESLTIKDADNTVDEKLARLLLSVQGRVNSPAEVSALITQVAAIARLTLSTRFGGEDDGSSREFGEKIKSVLALLLSQLPCPQEVNSSWLWSFTGPWTDHGKRSLDELGADYGSYVSEVCAASLCFLQLLWSKRHESFSSYLVDLQSCLSENQFLASTVDDRPPRVRLIKRLALLQENFYHVLEERSLQANYISKEE
ncbi:hypothetical protein R1flu_010878 [Riccia fluitans]|uniref:Nucleolar pre-ribosomal-associated protein 1 n=1 Tax=Riccia fluitans TaxID=41844 RepID=A0ABD1Z6K1_9MARC